MGRIVRIYLAAIVLCLLVVPSIQGQNAGSTLAATDKQAFEAALKAQDEGRNSDAVSILKTLSSKYPANFEIAESLGVAYAEDGKFAEAVPFMEKAVHVRPSSAMALANLGAAYLKVNRVEDAVRALRQSAKLDPNNVETQSNLGIALMQAKHSKEAAQAFSQSAALKSPDDDLLYNWALALFDAGDYAQAQQVVQRATNINTSPQSQALLGDISEHQNKYQEAVGYYETAVKLDPSEANVYALGIEFMRHWTFDTAIKIFETGVKQYPASTRMLMGLGIANYSNNNFAAAAPIFARLLDADPNNAFVADLLGHNCSLMSDDSPGCSKLIDFAERHPRNATVATYAAASILHRPSDQQDLNRVQQLLHQAIAADPKLAEAYYQSGILEQQKKDWQGSVDPLEKAIALKPDFSKAHYRLALAYSHTDQHEKAQQQIALQQQFSKQEKDDLNAHLRSVTTFVVEQH